MRSTPIVVTQRVSLDNKQTLQQLSHRISRRRSMRVWGMWSSEGQHGGRFCRTSQQCRQQALLKAGAPRPTSASRFKWFRCVWRSRYIGVPRHSLQSRLPWRQEKCSVEAPRSVTLLWTLRNSVCVLEAVNNGRVVICTELSDLKFINFLQLFMFNKSGRSTFCGWLGDEASREIKTFEGNLNNFVSKRYFLQKRLIIFFYFLLCFSVCGTNRSMRPWIKSKTSNILVYFTSVSLF